MTYKEQIIHDIYFVVDKKTFDIVRNIIDRDSLVFASDIKSEIDNTIINTQYNAGFIAGLAKALAMLGGNENVSTKG